MSVEAMALVLHHSRAKGTSKLVLLGIANHSGDGGAWPTVATLAHYAGTGERQVQKVLRELVGLGELAVYVQQGGLAGMHPAARPNRYEVLVVCPPGCDGTSNHRVKPYERPADPTLWITPSDPVSSGTPGVLQDTPPLSSGTPGGVSSGTPEPSLEPSSTPVETSQVTTDRARAARAYGTPPPPGLLDQVRAAMRGDTPDAVPAD